MAISPIYQMRRGTSTQTSQFTGSQGEILIETNNFRAIVCDGQTHGGFPVARADLTPINNAAHTVGSSEATVVYTALSLIGKTVTLPNAARYPLGQALRIQDMSGAANTFNITVSAPSTTPTQHINGATSIVINTAFGGVTLYTQGSSQWVAWSS